MWHGTENLIKFNIYSHKAEIVVSNIVPLFIVLFPAPENAVRHTLRTNEITS